MADQRIVIAGAGAIGCYVGGHLAGAGRSVSFLARPRIVEELSVHGLTLTDPDGGHVRVDRSEVSIGPDPELLAAADIVLVTVKSGSTVEMAREIKRFAPQGTVVVSLQNGVENTPILERELPAMRVVAGMVPYNVISRGEGRFHRTTPGLILVAAGVPGLAEALATKHMPVESHPDMPSVAWGKLLLNLNNALNALAGIPLKEELADRRWRILLADSIDEARAALKANGIVPAQVGPVPVARLPTVLRLPNFLFGIVAARRISIDPLARSSMWDDLEKRRITEIDQLQGAVVALAAAAGLKARTNARVLNEVRLAQERRQGSPKLQPSDLGG